MMLDIPSIDGGFGHLDEDQIVKMVKMCYHKIAKIPSRGVWGYNTHYASAAGALAKGLKTDINDFLPGFSYDWQEGFKYGFESVGNPPTVYMSKDEVYLRHHNSQTHVLTSREWCRGFNVGQYVANAIFSWEDSPNIHSTPQKGYE